MKLYTNMSRLKENDISINIALQLTEDYESEVEK